MALPVMTYNQLTGDNALSSGAGPATAINGAAGAVTGAHTGGVLSSTIQLPAGTDLSLVAVDGSHVIHLGTAAGGRHISKITAKDDGLDTVTLQDSFTISSGASAVSWAIGGKRQNQYGDTTWNDCKDAYSGWAHELEDGATFVLGVAIDTINADGSEGKFIIRPAAGHNPTIDLNGSKRYYSSTTSGQHFDIVDMAFLNSGSWGGASPCYINHGNCVVSFLRNDVNGAGMAYAFNGAASGAYTVNNNTIYNVDQAVGQGVIVGGRASLTALGNSITGCLGESIKAGNSSSFPATMIGWNTCYKNGKGIIVSGNLDQDGGRVWLLFNTVDSNTGDGLEATPATLGDFPTLQMRGNNFTNNGGWGRNLSVDVGLKATDDSDYNNSWNNTAGNDNNVPVAANDTSVDPEYVSIAGGSEDYGLQASSPLKASVPSGPSA